MAGNTVATSVASVRIKRLSVSHILWGGLWFYIGANAALSILLRYGLYIASVINTVMSVFLGVVLGMLALRRPSVLKFSLVPWIFSYFFWLPVSAWSSPIVGEQNLLRVGGLLAGKASIVLAIIVGFKLVNFPYALTLASRWFIRGVLLVSILLLVHGLEPIPVTNRLGDLELINSKMLGQYISIAIPMLFFLPISRLPIVRYSLLVFFAVLLIAIFGKASILATAVGVTAGWLLARRKSPAFFVFAIAFGLLSIAYNVPEQVQTYINSPLAPTLTNRVPVWRFLLLLVEERPLLGYGFGTVKDVLPAQALGWSVLITQAHNAFLDSLFSGGYIGLIIFSLTIINAVSLIVRCVWKLRRGSLAAFLLSTLVILLIRSTVEASLHLGSDFFVLVLIALSASSVLSSPKSTQVKGRNSWGL
ncbi:MAG: O-antigen ligase family protein [Candidatus Methanomethylicaceae archaeon]